MNFLSLFRPTTTIIGSSQVNCFYRRCTRNSSSSAPTNTQPKPSEPLTTSIPRSSCPADTILTGLNYIKGQPPIVAQPDEAYPEWLWTILKAKEHEDDGPGGRKERAERRKANRQAIKDRNFMQTQ